MADNSEKLENEAAEAVSEVAENKAPDENREVDNTQNAEDVTETESEAEKAPAEDNAPEATEEAEKTPVEDNVPEATEEAEKTAAEDNAPEAKPEAEKNALIEKDVRPKSFERKKSDEDKLEELKYAEEYRRKLQIEQEKEAQDDKDGEALRALREEEEKNKEAALLRDREEARSHSEKMSALIAKMESTSEEKEASQEEKEASQEEKEASEEEEKEALAEENAEDTVSDSEEAKSSDTETEDEPSAEDAVTEESSTTEEAPKDESMVISIDSDISSNVLTVEGVSVSLGEEAGAETESTAKQIGSSEAEVAGVVSSVPYESATIVSAEEQKTGEYFIPIQIPEKPSTVSQVVEDKKKGEKQPKDKSKGGHRAQSAIEADLDIATGVGAYVEYGKSAPSSFEGVNRANEIFDNRERQLDAKERKRLEKLELERLASKESMAYDKKPAQDEIIYPDKEITDDVLIAAGMLERSRETIDDKGAATQEPVIVEKKYAEPIKEEAVVIEQPAEKVEPAIVAPEVTYEDVPAPEKDKTYIEQPDDTVYPDVPSPVASGTEELDAFGAMYADALDKKKSKKSRKEKKGKKDKYSIDELAAYDSMMESDLSHKKAEKDSELESFGKEYEEKKDLKSASSKDSEDRNSIAAYEAACEKKQAKAPKKSKQKKSKDKTPVTKGASDKLDKKQLKKFIKQDSAADIRYITERYEKLIREKKLEIDASKMRFSKKLGRHEKSESELRRELDLLKREYKKELRREQNDNKRFYIPVMLDYRTERVRKGAKREDLIALRNKLLALLNERQDLNARLVNLYLGNEEGNVNVSEKRTAAEIKGRRSAYKKQRKLEREIIDHHISLSYATKLRSLMDSYVEKYGLLANLKAGIKSRKTGRKAKRDFKREARRTKKELMRIEADIEHYKVKAIREAEDRRSARFGMAIGWTLFIGLCAMGIACWAFWDEILLFVRGLLGF